MENLSTRSEPPLCLLLCVWMYHIFRRVCAYTRRYLLFACRKRELTYMCAFAHVYMYNIKVTTVGPQYMNVYICVARMYIQCHECNNKQCLPCHERLTFLRRYWEDPKHATAVFSRPRLTALLLLIALKAIHTYIHMKIYIWTWIHGYIRVSTHVYIDIYMYIHI